MKALILAADGVEDSEYYYPYYRLLEEGIQVHTAGPSADTFTGKHGYTFKADITFEDINPDDYDLLILPGGKAPETVRLNSAAVSAVKKIFNASKPVAAICHGAQNLISADLLQGKKATCWAGIRDDIKAAGAQYSDQPVVVDKNLITSRCPDDLPAFTKEIMKKLK